MNRRYWISVFLAAVVFGGACLIPQGVVPVSSDNGDTQYGHGDLNHYRNALVIEHVEWKGSHYCFVTQYEGGSREVECPPPWGNHK